jgi:hypothetical protein
VFTNILCAAGLAPSSIGVVRQALSLAWETHGRVVFVCVMTEPKPSPSEIRTELLAAIPPAAQSWCGFRCTRLMTVRGISFCA